jgi:beta-phosphoglucomutase-like phosphatase (HAD superfamily)
LKAGAPVDQFWDQILKQFASQVGAGAVVAYGLFHAWKKWRQTADELEKERNDKRDEQIADAKKVAASAAAVASETKAAIAEIKNTMFAQNLKLEAVASTLKTTSAELKEHSKQLDDFTRSAESRIRVVEIQADQVITIGKDIARIFSAKKS